MPKTFSLSNASMTRKYKRKSKLVLKKRKSPLKDSGIKMGKRRSKKTYPKRHYVTRRMSKTIAEQFIDIMSSSDEDESEFEEEKQATPREKISRLFGLYAILSYSIPCSPPSWCNKEQIKQFDILMSDIETDQVSFAYFSIKKQCVTVYTRDILDALVYSLVVHEYNHISSWMARALWWKNCRSGSMGLFDQITIKQPDSIPIPRDINSKFIFTPQSNKDMVTRTIHLPDFFFKDPYFCDLVRKNEINSTIFMQNYLWTLIHMYVTEKDLAFILSSASKKKRIEELMPFDEAVRRAYYVTVQKFKSQESV